MKTISLQDPSKLNATNVESKHLLVEDAVADAFFLLIIVRIVEPFWFQTGIITLFNVFNTRAPEKAGIAGELERREARLIGIDKFSGKE